jgi:hypothetical protein
MAKREHRRNEYGYDVPVHRDWLFWSVLPIAAMIAIFSVMTGRAQPGEAVLQIGGALTIAGVLLGSVRELVRGFREPHEDVAPVRVRSDRR